MWSSLLEIWTLALTPHTPQTLILMKWPLHQGYVMVTSINCQKVTTFLGKHIHIPNTIIFFTFYNMLFEIWYQTHFLHYDYFKHIFSKYILIHSFYIILNNNTWKLLPNKTIITPKKRKKKRKKLMISTIQNFVLQLKQSEIFSAL